MDDCDVTDSPRGINFRPRVDDASLSVTNSHFQDMIGAAVQMGESNAGETVALNLRGNNFERCEYGVYVHEFAQGDGSVVSTSNSYTDCSSDFYYGSGDDGSASEFVISSNGDRFEKNGYTTSAPTIGSESSSAPVVDVTDPVMDTVRPPIIWDDDDEYIPPIVPAQPSDSEDDNTTTIVACAAAAVVAAGMAFPVVVVGALGFGVEIQRYHTKHLPQLFLAGDEFCHPFARLTCRVHCGVKVTADRQTFACDTIYHYAHYLLE